MLKKLAITAALLAATTGIAMADSAPYVGVSSGLLINTMNVNGYTGAYRGMPFNVFAGYGGLVTCDFYLMGELQGTLTTASFTDESSLKSTYGGSISILPGYLLSQYTVAFARIGVIDTHFTADSQNRVGGLFGVGVQADIAQSLDMRLEYDYAAYKSISKDNVSGNPQSDEITIGLIYKFG